MTRLLYELTESFRIAFAQIRANKLRSVLTALGVIIGIVAVTLMGTAIRGIDTGFNKSLAMLGDDVLYVQKWPWGPVEDFWNYTNRPPILPDQAEKLNRVIEQTPNSLLEVAVPVSTRSTSVKFAENKVSGVFTIGTTADYGRLISADFSEGRLFNDTEANGGRPVCVLGFDVAEAVFQTRSPLGATVLINGHPFTVIGVVAKQGSFLGLFSFDNQAILPLEAFRKYFSVRRGAELRVKITDKTRVADAREELIGAVRRVRGQLPGGKQQTKDADGAGDGAFIGQHAVAGHADPVAARSGHVAHGDDHGLAGCAGHFQLAAHDL
jgi:putative ABC transport system permease protein